MSKEEINVSLFGACLIIIAAWATSTACAPAKSNDISVQMLLAGDGSQCYAIVQNGEVKAGSCR